MNRKRVRIIALVLIIAGLAMAIAIDAYETAYRLNFGVLPWRAMSALGLFLLLLSFRRWR